MYNRGDTLKHKDTGVKVVISQYNQLFQIYEMTNGDMLTDVQVSDDWELSSKYEIGDKVASKMSSAVGEITEIHKQSGEYTIKVTHENKVSYVNKYITLFDMSDIHYLVTNDKTTPTTTCSHVNKKVVPMILSSFWLCSDCKADLGNVK